MSVGEEKKAICIDLRGDPVSLSLHLVDSPLGLRAAYWFDGYNITRTEAPKLLGGTFLANLTRTTVKGQRERGKKRGGILDPCGTATAPVADQRTNLQSYHEGERCDPR